MGIRHYRETLEADPAAWALHQAEVARLMAEQAQAIDEEERAMTERSRERIRALWRSRGKVEVAPPTPRLTAAKVRGWVEREAAEAAALLLEASKRDPALRDALKARIL